MSRDELRPDLFLPLAFGGLGLVWVGWILAMALHADGAFFAFILGPFVLLEMVMVPVVSIVEIGYLLYFLHAGGSLFNLDLREQRGREYRKLLPHLLGITFLGVFYFLAWNPAVKDWCYRRGRLTTDAELIDNFRRNRLDFEKLLALKGQPSAAESKRLIRKLKLHGGILGKELAAYRDGWALSSESKGYVYEPSPPMPILPSLDGPLPKDTHISYRKIDDNWYLYESWW